MKELKTTKMEWISVKDGLPKSHISGSGAKYYLIRLGGKYQYFDIGILIDGVWHSDFSRVFNQPVTHWCDVP